MRQGILALLFVVAVLAGCDRQSPSIPKLPAGWFARYAAERRGPAELSGPVEEYWRIEDASARGVTISGGRAFVIKLPIRFAGPSQVGPSGTPQFESNPTVMCIDLASGTTLWTLDVSRAVGQKVGGVGLAAFEGLVLVRGFIPRQVMGSPHPVASFGKRLYLLLDAAHGAVLRSFGPQEVPLEREEPGTFKRPATASATAPGDAIGDAIAAWLEGRKNELLTQRDALAVRFFSSGPAAVAPVSDDPALWTWKDVESLFEVLHTPYVTRQGLAEGAAFVGANELMWFGSDGFSLIEAETKRVRWSVRHPPIAPPRYLWNPPHAIFRASQRSIMAHDVQTGDPAWVYEWPEGPETYTFAMLALKDGLLLLTDPVTSKPPMISKDPATGATTVGLQQNPTLTRLDRKGKPVFLQELPFSGGYCQFTAWKDRLVVWSQSGMVAGYRPSAKGVGGNARAVKVEESQPARRGDHP